MGVGEIDMIYWIAGYLVVGIGCGTFLKLKGGYDVTSAVFSGVLWPIVAGLGILFGIPAWLNVRSMRRKK